MKVKEFEYIERNALRDKAIYMHGYGIYKKLAALVCESINDDCVGFCNLTSPTNCFQCHCIAKHLVENGVTLVSRSKDDDV